MTSLNSTSKALLWTGRIVQWLLIALLLFDAAGKVLKLDAVMKGTVQAGFPANSVLPIGLSLLVGVILYAIPRTAVLGAILLTGYLGGAVATNVHQRFGLGFILFPAIIGALAWGAIYLQDARLREMIPLRRYE